jgi:hypothetical protein
MFSSVLFLRGFNIGCRLIEDFLAKSAWPRCRSFAESVSVLAAVAFKMFLNCTPVVSALTVDSEYLLTFGADGDESGTMMPLLEFVQIPDSLSGLKYLNVLPGIIRGAFSMIHQDIQCFLLDSKTAEAQVVRIQIKFNRLIEESLPPGE